MSAPWMKFYPTDWRADPSLRMCSLAARGLWMEMLCIMHEATPYGSLRVNGRPVSDRQLAALAGGEIDALLVELEDAGVFSREEDGTIYSRRMQRDAEKAARDKANGRKGGNPDLKAGVNPPDKAQKPEARVTEPSGSDAAGVDPRDALWRDGVSILKAMTGKTDGAARSLIGRWCRDARDDCSIVLSKIRTAQAERIGDPVSWITAALKPPGKPPPKQTVGQQARDELKRMGLLDAPDHETRHNIEGDGSPGFAGTGIARRIAIASGG